MLLNEIGSKSNSCEDLRDEITDTLVFFRKKIDKYQKSKLKRAVFEDLKDELDNSFLLFYF